MVSNEGSFFSTKTDQLVNFDNEPINKSPTQKETERKSSINQLNEKSKSPKSSSPDIQLP
jgi:hypothetical protein